MNKFLWVGYYAYDIFLQNLLKAFIAIDPLSLLPLFVVLTSKLKLKKILELSFLVFIITSSVLTFFQFSEISF